MWTGIGTLLVLTAIIAGRPTVASGHEEVISLASRPLTEGELQRLAGRMDPALRALALRHDPGVRRPDLWGRPEGWASLDIDQAPTLGETLDLSASESAQALNALRPFARLPIRPMEPFVLMATGADRARAVQCLSEAIYYEAAREPEVGQEAVAQVVLNRLRHPAYPKSICGVVYQGAGRSTGCQFTFTCDGSMRFAPEPVLWARARMVAERALNGYVDRTVGSATHYHADYVAPYWAPTLVKMVQVGAHIFYRWTGPWGEPAAFTGRYAGGEDYLSPAILGGIDTRTQGGVLEPETAVPVERKVTLAVAGETRTYSIVDPTAPTSERVRMSGALLSSRRQPTPEEVRRINQTLEALERSMDVESRPAAAQP